MNDLIKITYENDTPLVSARELHKFLEVGTKFQDWFPRMCEYGFAEGVDFNPLKFENVPSQKRERTYSTMDYALTVDMAKEISMLQRNEKGKLARQYFIQLERDWNSPEKVMARALKMATARLEEVSGHNLRLLSEVERNKPKALFADAVATSKTSILVGELAKLLKQNGVDMGQNRLFAWLRSKGYLISRIGTDYNMPTQKSMELGLFEIKETVISHGDGHTSVNKTPKVTGKGQLFFSNRFLEKDAAGGERCVRYNYSQ